MILRVAVMEMSLAGQRVVLMVEGMVKWKAVSWDLKLVEYWADRWVGNWGALTADT